MNDEGTKEEKCVKDGIEGKKTINFAWSIRIILFNKVRAGQDMTVALQV